MSEIKNVGKTWMTKCNQLTHLSFKGLMYFIMGMNVWNNYGGGVGKYFAWTATHS